MIDHQHQHQQQHEHFDNFKYITKFWADIVISHHQIIQITELKICIDPRLINYKCIILFFLEYFITWCLKH